MSVWEMDGVVLGCALALCGEKLPEPECSQRPAVAGQVTPALTCHTFSWPYTVSPGHHQEGESLLARTVHHLCYYPSKLGETNPGFCTIQSTCGQ